MLQTTNSWSEEALRSVMWMQYAPHLVCGQYITLDMGIGPASACYPSKFMRSLAANCAAHQLNLNSGMPYMRLCCKLPGALWSRTAATLRMHPKSVPDRALHAERGIHGGRILQRHVQIK